MAISAKEKQKKTKQWVDWMEVQITNKLDQFQVGFRHQAQQNQWDNNILVAEDSWSHEYTIYPLFSEGLIWKQ